MYSWMGVLYRDVITVINVTLATCVLFKKAWEPKENGGILRNIEESMKKFYINIQLKNYYFANLKYDKSFNLIGYFILFLCIQDI